MTTATTRDLLLEIGTEEIPARMLDQGAADLRACVEQALASEGLAATGGRTFHSPRRLAVLLSGLPARQADREDIAYGPAVRAAFDAEGRPTKAAEGFARSQGVDPSLLERMNGPKGEVVGVRKAVAGRDTLDVLADALPVALGRLAFPKAMRWASGTGPFARPVHWIVALFGDQVVPLTFCGIASGRSTRGHRFQAPEPVEVGCPDDWEGLLVARRVTVRPEVRRAAIDAALADAVREPGCTFLANDALKSEVANLVEDPNFAIGTFDPDFLNLPREVLVTAMASHQRYFAMQDADGRLLPRFGVVANNRTRDMAVVVRGNERVLAARLYDARFFWNQDLKSGIGAMAQRLPQRLFLKGAGDMAEKTTRVRDLAAALADAAGLDAAVRADTLRAAELCKADLMSNLVGEFPELQGVMGMYFARAAGESEAVAQAIREHYLPRFAGDDLPATPAGAVLALADRIDSIVACFRAGAIPTGSKDPLALRRQAIGVLKLLADLGFKGVTLARVLELAGLAVGDPVRDTVFGFFRDRFHGILTGDFDVPADFANALLDTRGDDRPADVITMAVALRDFARRTDGFTDFLDNVFKRVANILKQADDKVPGWRDAARAQGLLDIDAGAAGALETEVERGLDDARRAALGAYHAAMDSGDYDALLGAMYSFRDPLARFFGSGRDGVPVLIEGDEQKRLARLALLYRVFSLFNWYADFTRISTR